MRKKIFIFSFSFVILGLFIYFPNNFSFGYSTTYSHPKLTREIANLYNRSYPENLISNQELEWLIKGAVDEDTPLRYVNHFYDPIHNQPWLGRNPVALTAKDWAQSPNYQIIFAKGNQTWQKAINSYLKGDKKSSFIALGHILHLIEDMAVSEHTRNDTHLPYVDESPYEKWVEQNIQKINLSFNQTSKKFSYLDNYFDSLAFYSNNHFFSKNTINTYKYSYPKLIKCNNDLEYGFVSGVKIKYGCSVVEDKIFRLVKITREADWRNPEIKPIYELDPNVLFDYFSLLGSQAISHGAGVIKLFFEEVERQKQLEEQKSWWQKIKKKAGDLFSATLLSLIKEEPAPSPAQPIPSPSEEPPTQPEIAPKKEEIIVSPPSPSKTLDETTRILEKPEKPEQPQITPKTEEPKPPEPELKPEEISKTPEKPSEQESPPSSEEQSSIITSSAKPSHHDEPILPDNEPPETYATSTLFTNNQLIATSTAIFEFSSSEENSTFECQLDNATSTTCTFPQTYENLSDGTHTFQVRAIDSAGNQDQTPSIISWTIDITAPSISNIATSNITRNSVNISFLTNEPAFSQIEYGTTTTYTFQTGWTNSTSTSHSISLFSFLPGTQYHFQLKVKDILENATTSPDNVFTTSAQAVNIVISEIQINGTTTLDEFVELYNPTNSDINLAGWRLTKKTASGATTENLLTTFPDKVIPAFGYFLIAHPSGYDGGMVPDAVYSTTASIAPNNTVILYSDAGQTIVDLVGLGNATISEGLTIDNPLANYSIERKATATSTAQSLATGTDKWQGNAYDTDNNSQDFVLQDSPTPQNSQSLTEPRNSLPTLAADAAWPMKQRDSKRQAQILAPGLASTTLQVSSSTLVSSPPENLISLSLSNSQILVTSTKGLFALDLTNINQLWFYPTDDIATPPLISSDGTTYVRADDALYAFNSSGSLKWKYPIGGNYYNFSLNIDKNGIIYTVSNGRVYAFYPDGKIKWIFDISQLPVLRSFSGHIGSPAIDNERERIYLNIEQYLYALDFNGNFVWDFRNSPLFPTSTTTSFSSPTIGNDGTIYFSTLGQVFASGGFYALNPDVLNPNDRVKWFNSIGYGGNASRSPAIGPDGTVYFVDVRYSGGGAGAELFAFDPDTGLLKWPSPASLPGSYPSSPIVTSDTIYLASDWYILAFDLINGSEKWRWADSPRVYLDSGFGAVGADGSLYFTGGGKFYRFGE